MAAMPQDLTVPLLLVPAGDDGSLSASPDARELLDFTTNKHYKLPLLPNACNTSIVGSSFGWLVTMDCSIPSKHEIQLFNPITGAHIMLPPATTFDNFASRDGFPLEYFIEKAITFSAPTSGCMVMAIHGLRRELAFCRIGDKRWTSFENLEQSPHYKDVIYHKGQFYAVTQKAAVVVCEFDPIPKVVEVMQLPNRTVHMKYLVESSGELLMVTRIRGRHDYRKTLKFIVEKLDLVSKLCEEVTSLDNQVMFLGNSRSLSVSANEKYICLSNCIYFVDDYSAEAYTRLGSYDMGVFELNNKTITASYAPSRIFGWAMFWITPTTQEVPYDLPQ